MNTLIRFFSDNTAYVCFLLTWAVQLFICRYYVKLRKFQKKQCREIKESSANESVTVIVLSHNEADALRRNLPAILEQDHESYEVIVIDMASTDNTADVLAEMESRYPHLRHSFIPTSSRYISEERMAITIGVKAALYDLILLTKADCRPRTSRWIQTMTAAFKQEKQIVLGYTDYAGDSLYRVRRMSFFRFFQQLMYLTWAVDHKAYRGDICNMGYRKSFFMSHKGFADDFQLVEGSGDILANYHSTINNTAVVLQHEAIIEQEIPNKRNWKEKLVNYMETRRHLKHSFMYRMKFNFIQSMPVISLFCWIGSVALSVIRQQWIATGIFTASFLALVIYITILLNHICNKTGIIRPGIAAYLYLVKIPFWHLNALLNYLSRPRRSFWKKGV